MNENAKAVIQREARLLLRAMRRRLPDYFENPKEEFTLTRTETGRVAMGMRGLWFFISDHGELTAGRTDENGEPEFGGIDSDGNIRWGWALVATAPGLSMN